MAKSIVSDKQTRFERGDGRMEVVPAGLTSLPGLLRLGGNAVDIQPTGPQAADRTASRPTPGTSISAPVPSCARRILRRRRGSTLTITSTTLTASTAHNIG